MKTAKVFPLESFTIYGNTGSLQKSGLHLYKFLVEYFCRWDKAHSLQCVYLQMFLKQRDRDNLLLRVADKISSIHVSTVDTNTTLAQRHTHTPFALRQTDGWTNRWMEQSTGINLVGTRPKQFGSKNFLPLLQVKQTERQTNKQTDRQTNKQIDGQTNRQTDTTYRYITH